MNYTQIQFSDRKSEIDLDQLQQLFNLSAFWAQGRSIEDLSIAIANSEPVISVSDGEQLVGFARATSDGIYRATIWDVVIHPEYRGRGLGSKLVYSSRVSWSGFGKQISRNSFESSSYEVG